MAHHKRPGIGDVPHGYPDANNPIKIGGKASTALPTAVDNGDRVDIYLDQYGQLYTIFGGKLNPNDDQVGQMVFNDSTWEALRNNVELAIISSAQRTVTNNSSDLVNRNGKRFLLMVNVSAIGAPAGSMTPSLQVKDPISNGYSTIWTAAAALVATTATPVTYYFGEGAVGGLFTESQPFGLPARVFRILCTHNNANNISYSVSGVILL